MAGVHDDDSKRYRRPRHKKGMCFPSLVRPLCVLGGVVVICAGCWWLVANSGLVPSHTTGPPPRPKLRPFGASVLDRWAQSMLTTIDAHAPSIAQVVHTVGGRVAVVVDGAVSEKERKRVADRYAKLTGEGAQQGWHREKASDLSLEHNAMAKDLPYDECDAEALATIRTLAPHFYSQCSPERPIWVTRCSIYMQTYIDVDEAHQDRSHDAIAFSVTAIWYPHERWHAHWGGETVFLSDSGGADADLLLPVLPKPRRLLMFDSEIPHMAKPCSPISEPFSPPLVSHVTRPSTRTSGNRFSFVLRTLCGRHTVDELLSKHDVDKNGKLSRYEVMAMFRALDIDRPDGAIVRLGNVANGANQFTADHLKTFFDIRYAGDAPRAVNLDNATLSGGR